MREKENRFYETELGYLRYWEIPIEFIVSETDMRRLYNAERCEVINIEGHRFRCVGTIEELEKANDDRRKQIFSMAKRNMDLSRENARLRRNLKAMSDMLKPILETMEISGIDIIDTETGEVLSN